MVATLDCGMHYCGLVRVYGQHAIMTGDTEDDGVACRNALLLNNNITPMTDGTPNRLIFGPLIRKSRVPIS